MVIGCKSVSEAFHIRPLLREDAPSENIPEDIPIVGMTMTSLDGEVLAYAGIMTWGGMHFAFFTRKEGVHHPLAFYRLTLDGMERCEKLGFTPIYVLADTDYSTAERWLKKLRFSPLEDDKKDQMVRIMEEYAQRKIWVRM
jgi:hypothetical protein